MNPSEHISIAETVEDLVALMELERLELDLFRDIRSSGETSVRTFGAMLWHRRLQQHITRLRRG